MDTTTQKQLLELYISNVDIICDGFPLSINSARAGFLESFNILSLPTIKDERYRHCNVQRLFEGEWEHYFTPVDSSGAERAAVPVESYCVRLHNGFCAENAPLLKLENGVVIGSLRSAIFHHEDIISRYYNTLADNESEALTALSSAFMQDAAFVYVPEGVSLDLPVSITYDYSTQEVAQMCFARSLIVVESGAKVDIVVEHRTLDESRFLVNHVRESFVGDGATVNFTELTDMNDASTLFISAYTRQRALSNVKTVGVWLRGGATRVNSHTKLTESYCTSELYGLYMAGGQELTDLNVTVEHLKSDCRSFQQVKGVVGGEATGAFRGRVYVATDAQRTSAMQQSRNLQLSDTARIFTEPQLEIYADDVKCSHGATVGQLDSESVYYMRQRGLSEQDARRLQMHGFVNDVVSHCSDQLVATYISELTESRIEDL